MNLQYIGPLGPFYININNINPISSTNIMQLLEQQELIILVVSIKVQNLSDLCIK